jgi:hypothetical protein
MTMVTSGTERDIIGIGRFDTLICQQRSDDLNVAIVTSIFKG